MTNLEKLRKIHSETGVIKSTLDWTPEDRLEEVATAMLAAHEYMSCPINRTIGLLKGESFLLLDASVPKFNVKTWTREKQTHEEHQKERLGNLLNTAADLLEKLK